MDRECIKLCKALNKLGGISTIESCCGHNRDPYRIWFWCSDIKFLPPALYFFDR